MDEIITAINNVSLSYVVMTDHLVYMLNSFHISSFYLLGFGLGRVYRKKFDSELFRDCNNFYI